MNDELKSDDGASRPTQNTAPPTTAPATRKHWRLETDAQGIAWLYFDKQGTSANTLSYEVFDELEAILADFERNTPKGLVLLSGKASGFIAGADVSEFTAISDEQHALAMIQRGQGLVSRLEALRCPSVALIQGFSLGGGLELALGCTFRIAVDDPKTRLGLPEVRLGIHPGFGGTVRSIAKIGAPAAMDLMLTGRTIDARAAQRIGLVDRTVPERQAKVAAVAMLSPGRKPRKPAWYLRALNTFPLRGLFANYLSKQVAKKAIAAHYPAPFALIDLYKHNGGNRKKMMDAEAISVSKLITGDTARNLIRVFFLQERMKGLGRASDFQPKHVHVIGAGTMGGDIAAWCAAQGFTVTLQDREPKFIAPAIKRAAGLYAKRFKDRRLRQAAMDRLMPDIAGSGVKLADVVIEAIVENIEIKQDLFRKLEPQLKPDAILATNTSSIPLDILSQALKKPERLVGLHFFNPVAKMQLVEIVLPPSGNKEVVAKASAFTKAIDRLPLPVKSAPGFLVNRILMPYMMESLQLVAEGVPPATIDKAAVEFGMPMGPVELADTVGLDICLAVGKVLGEKLNLQYPDLLREKVEAGKLGRKSGEGFYVYKKGQKVTDAKGGAIVTADTTLAERMILRMLNESVACLREQVVEDADLLDAGMIFGTGFAPFRGGPLHFLAREGGNVVSLPKRVAAE